jgi:hypothetical protein
MNIFCIESFFAQKTRNRTLLFGSTVLKHGHIFSLKSASEYAHARLIHKHIAYMFMVKK